MASSCRSCSPPAAQPRTTSKEGAAALALVPAVAVASDAPWANYRRVKLLDQQIHAPILCRPHDEVAVHLPTERQKGKHIAIAVAHMDPLHSRWGFADGLRTAFPDLRLSLSLLSLLAWFLLLVQADAGKAPDAPGPALDDSQARQPALFAAGSRGGCHYQWDPIPWSSDAAGSPLASCLGSATPAQAFAHRLSRLLDMRADQLLIGDIGCLQEEIGRVQGRLASPICLGNEAAGSAAMALAMATARSVRRTSPRCTLPKVYSAQCRADNMVLGFIIGALSRTVLHHSLMNSTISRPENCDKQSGGRPGVGHFPRTTR